MAVITYYFCTSSGRSPVKDFIDSLDLTSQRKFFSVKSMLEEFGHRLTYPHAKYIGDGTFELRFSGGEGAIRVMYFFLHNDAAIFTNGFIKKTKKTPLREKLLAIQRRKAYYEANES